MKTIRKFKKYLAMLLIIATGSLTSCDFMDIVPDMIPTIEDNAFSMRAQAEKFFFTCYSYMPNFGSHTGDPAILGGDEIWQSDDFLARASIPAQLAMGNQVVSSPLFCFWTGTNGGKPLFRAISDCNIFLANINRTPDITDAERRRWRAEVEVLKAFYHYYLVKLYGPIPIKDVNLTVQDDTQTTHVFRNTLDECFNYMVNKVDSIIKLEHLLTETNRNDIEDFGRITQGIAMMMKAKMLVTAASPLFNGNTDYIGLVDKRGIEIFNPTKTDEEKRLKWEKAAIACKEAIDYFREMNQHFLYEYYDENLADITNTVLSIRGAMTERYPVNREIIWAQTNTWPTVNQLQSHPTELTRDRGGQNPTGGDRNNWGVPLKITTWFYTKNGVPIDEDKDWDFANRFTPRRIGEDQRYMLYETGVTAGMNFDRELRYYASFGFDRGIWYGQGNPETVFTGSSAETNQRIQARQGEYSSNLVIHNWNRTNIWPKKILHYQTSITSTITYRTYPFPIYRLADLFLMYAEALNEAYDTQTARDEAIEYVDRVRTRARLEGIADSWEMHSTDPDKYKRQAGLRDIIRQEKLIEFVFEGHRFWDLRRWKLAMQEYNRPITGWNVGRATPEEYYIENHVFTRWFTPRDYFWPISDVEILRNGNTRQNFGW